MEIWKLITQHCRRKECLHTQWVAPEKPQIHLSFDAEGLQVDFSQLGCLIRQIVNNVNFVATCGKTKTQLRKV